MFELAFLIGVYAYSIFLLGILGLLYKNIIILVSLIFISIILVYYKTKLLNIKSSSKLKNLSLLSKILLILIIIQALVNLIGVLGPEISFDALWYHLTLPKIFLQSHRIFHINGSLLYYSDLPKNIEMLYVAGLSFSNEILAKLIHYIFGLLNLILIFKISRKFLNVNYSFLSCVIFYSSLVVGWLSIVSYVDLGTAFFTSVSFYCFLEWMDKNTRKYLVFTAIITGFAIATKIVALNLIPIYIILILVLSSKHKLKYKLIFTQVLLFGISAIFFALPWFIFSFINTGNAFYPLFDSNLGIVNKFNFLSIFDLFLNSPDPINPIYLITIPLVIFSFIKFEFKIKILAFYSLLALFFWYINSAIGGSRFILPYLGVYSIVVSYTINILKDKNLKNITFCLIILLSVISITYRSLANYKFIPVVLGKESKVLFLSTHLNFSFGDFYDTDGYFKNNIKPTDKVLLYGFHNIYYVDFPFIDSSFAVSGDKFNYIATQNVNLPNRFSNWKEIYYNRLTNVKVYSLGQKQWVY
jgi:hypothetical protein